MNYVNVSVRMTEEEKKALIEFSEKHDLKMSQVMRKAMKEYIDNNEKERV